MGLNLCSEGHVFNKSSLSKYDLIWHLKRPPKVKRLRYPNEVVFSPIFESLITLTKSSIRSQQLWLKDSPLT